MKVFFLEVTNQRFWYTRHFGSSLLPSSVSSWNFWCIKTFGWWLAGRKPSEKQPSRTSFFSNNSWVNNYFTLFNCKLSHLTNHELVFPSKFPEASSLPPLSYVRAVPSAHAVHGCVPPCSLAAPPWTPFWARGWPSRSCPNPLPTRPTPREPSGRSGWWRWSTTRMWVVWVDVGGGVGRWWWDEWLCACGWCGWVRRYVGEGCVCVWCVSVSEWCVDVSVCTCVCMCVHVWVGVGVFSRVCAYGYVTAASKDRMCVVPVCSHVYDCPLHLRTFPWSPSTLVLALSLSSDHWPPQSLHPRVDTQWILWRVSVAHCMYTEDFITQRSAYYLHLGVTGSDTT